MRRAIAVAILLLPLACAALKPQPSAANTAPFPSPRSDAALDARLRFLDERLAVGRCHAAAWYWGWLGVEGFGGISQIADAAQADKGGDRARDIVNAVESTLGVLDILVLRPMPGRSGAAPLRAMPDGSQAEKLVRLARGEEILLAAAERAGARRSWPVHLTNLALNLVGGAVLLGLDHPGTAATTFASNFLGGELEIWTEPWRAPHDLEDYRHLVESGHGNASGSRRIWRVAPAAEGIALELRF